MSKFGHWVSIIQNMKYNIKTMNLGGFGYDGKKVFE